MQYNCINMSEFENGNKIKFSRVLRKCTDLELFDKELIQVIIDYKWDTYGFNFFRNKFMIYLIFMIVNLTDTELEMSKNEYQEEFKWTKKGICVSI